MAFPSLFLVPLSETLAGKLLSQANILWGGGAVGGREEGRAGQGVPPVSVGHQWPKAELHSTPPRPTVGHEGCAPTDSSPLLSVGLVFLKKKQGLCFIKIDVVNLGF